MVGDVSTLCHLGKIEGGDQNVQGLLLPGAQRNRLIDF